MTATSVTYSAVLMIATSTVDGWITSMPEKIAVQFGPLPGLGWQVTLALAGIVTGWNSDAATPLPDSIAWPAKNATNEVTSEITRVTSVNVIALAA
jgi:hypothetical protein